MGDTRRCRTLSRSTLCEPQSSPLGYLKNEHVCGRPLGFKFDKKDRDLYIVAAYFGIIKVRPEGGLATSLATGTEGVPFSFTNALDIDDDGVVYFTDSSTNYQRRNFLYLVFSAEDTGRVLKYDPAPKKTTVRVRNIQFPYGIALRKDDSFFIFCEGSIRSWNRYCGEELASIFSDYSSDIASEIPIHLQKLCYSAFATLLGLTLCLTWNIVAVTTTWIKGGDATIWFLAVIYFISGVPCACLMVPPTLPGFQERKCSELYMVFPVLCAGFFQQSI